MKNHKLITEESNSSEFRVFIYFPLEFPYEKTGFLYGEAFFNETDHHIVNIIVTLIKTEINEEDNQLKLVGTLNRKETRPDDKPPFVWLRLDSPPPEAAENTKIVRLKSVFIGNVSVSLSDSAVILYDGDIVKSELLETNENMENLCRLLSLNGQRKKKNENHAKIVESAFHNSKVLLQFHQRFRQLKSWRNSESEIDYYNLLLMMILDLILGIVALNIVYSIGGASYIVETFLTSFKAVADSLQLLIESLMGVPVGLKLNRPLSTVLGKFFLYHLYLWKTYIDVIMSPLISNIISISSVFGFIGLTFQMALLSDLITVASLHSYCFYVYAARLYGLALHGLRSTLRMFGGRKWNPLRQRVDSGHFNWDQLCVGMFIASTLLLLLPTIVVFYTVFSVLRVFVLSIHGTLKRLIWLINSFPSYSLILWILNSPSLAGDVKFEVISTPDDENSASVLKLVWIKLPLWVSLQRSLNPTTTDYPSLNCSQRLSEFISGQLIYPL